MQKLYCYIDESGDRPSQVFVVAAIVVASDPQQLLQVCEQVETTSGKGKAKWRKSTWVARMRYTRMIGADKRFTASLCYCVFRGRTDLHPATLQAIERALFSRHLTGEYRVWVYVDALSKKKRREYQNGLGHSGLPIYQVRGVAKEENNALIRLADALAGLVNDALTQHYPEAVEILHKLKLAGVVIEIEL